MEWLQSQSYSLHGERKKKKNPCQKNLHLWPSLERGSCGACCSSVWLMIGPCSLWSMTGPQWTSPIATTQMWQADQAGRHWPRWEQDRWEGSLRGSATQQNQTNCLRIHFRFPSLTVLQARPLFWLLQQVFFIYVLTLVFFTLPLLHWAPGLQG